MSRTLPILFNGEMVRAILYGRKTVTRRVIKHDKVSAVLNSPVRTENPDIPDEKFIKCLVNAPYEPGDILYVRETWAYGYIETSDQPGVNEAWFEPVKAGKHDGYIGTLSRYFYKANKDAPADDLGIIWKPSIHMPKEAARIWLKVTNIRVERLMDISGGELLKEGIEKPLLFDGNVKTAFDKFKELWNTTIKKTDLDRYGWEGNPWVWVIEFEQSEKPEEENEKD